MKPKTKKILKYGCFGIALLLLISFLILFKQGFGPIEETVKIKQEIGGELICKSTYSADIQSWYYFIDYKYQKENGEIIDIGNGEYFGRDWKKDEQLKKIGEWRILQTGGEYDTDKLLIGTFDNTEWRIFKISPSEIEKDNLWISENIFVKQNWLPQESFIKQIDGNKIEIEYLYRIGETVEEQETRLITYEIDNSTGIPKMTKIQLKK